MAAKLILSQPNPIANPDSPEFRAACENLSLCALGILAYMHYANKESSYQYVTMDELDPNCEPGVEEAVRALWAAGFIYVDGVL
jgi:hypothetical protein